MSATKRRNLKKKIIGCLCLAAIAASMTAAPFVPVISDMGVISASAETLQATVDLSQLDSYAGVADLGFTVTFFYPNWFEIKLQDGYDYTFTGTNSADVQIYVPNGVTASINFNNATIINDDGEYSTSAYTGCLSLGDECYINYTMAPFHVDGTLTVSGTLNVDTYSYYGGCSVDSGVKHGISAPLNEGDGTFNVSSFFTVKYLDENGISIDERYYLGGDESNIDSEYKCRSSSTGTNGETVVTARKAHIDEGIDGVCDNCGAATAVNRTVTFETNGGSTITSAIVANGQTLTAPTAPTKAGYTFAGWYTDAECTIPYNFTSAVTSDITLYAKWRVEVEVDLSRIVDYTSSAPTGFTAAYGDYGNNIIKLTLADGSYKFKGTNLVSGAYVDVKIIVPTGVNASIEFAEGSSIINDNGIYALTNGTYSEHNLANYCNINDYAVPFKVEAGGSLTVSGSLSVDTYSYYGECGDGDAHPAGHQWTAPLNEGSGTFTANFFIVKYVDENGLTIDQNFYLSGKTYTINTLPKTNFPKYYNGMNQYDPNDQASISDFPCLSFTGGTVSGAKTVTARTAHTAPDSNGDCANCGEHIADVAKIYTVTFETNGGSEVTAAQVTDGKTVSEPTAPTKAKADFSGWYTDEACTVPYDFTKPVTGNITLYAKWDKWAPNSIFVNTPPARIVYMEKDKFDPRGLVITVAYENGETENVEYSEANASEFTFSPSENIALTDKSVTITYGGKTTEQAITVNSIPPATPPSNNQNPTTKPPVSNNNGPKIEGENGKSGWNSISDKISKTPEGGTIKVDMNGTTELPKDIVSDIAGKDIDLVLDMGNGITWTINGKDVTNPKDIDLSVTANTNNIPVSIINNVTGEKYSIQISLAHEGEFGFTATLTIDLGSKNNGLYANLFYYNPKTKELEFMDYGKISGGKADLIFTHASDWAIVIDKEPLGDVDDVSSAAGAWADNDSVGTADKPAVFVIPVMAAAIGTAVFVRRKTKKQ